MLSKFSVKKPYTVVVGIVLIIILGIVSFRDMTVDLLPSMNLPYAIVMTTYPGASPGGTACSRADCPCLTGSADGGGIQRSRSVP